jgi:uncharacterized membrane protein
VRGLAYAAACLPAGFGVAVATGVRPLGGLVLLALAVLAGRQLRSHQALWYVAVLVCFVASHLLGDALSPWGAVAVVTVVATAAYLALGRRSARLTASLR